ncbi:hypothetical protein R6G99_02120 [Actinotignum timonense]|nr:hypothetical protein [Actinotignum timonense]
MTTLPRTITDIFHQEELHLAITCALEVARRRLLKADEWDAVARSLAGRQHAPARSALRAIALR